MFDAGAKLAEFLRAGQKLLSAEDPEMSCWGICFARAIPFPCKLLLHLGKGGFGLPEGIGILGWEDGGEQLPSGLGFYFHWLWLGIPRSAGGG